MSYVDAPQKSIKCCSCSKEKQKPKRDYPMLTHEIRGKQEKYLGDTVLCWCQECGLVLSSKDEDEIFGQPFNPFQTKKKDPLLEYSERVEREEQENDTPNRK